MISIVLTSTGAGAGTVMVKGVGGVSMGSAAASCSLGDEFGGS